MRTQLDISGPSPRVLHRPIWIVGVLFALVAFAVFGGSGRRSARPGTATTAGHETSGGPAALAGGPALAGARAGPRAPSNAAAWSQSAPFAAGTVLVGFRAGTGVGLERRLARAVGARDLRVIGAGTHVLALAGAGVSAAVSALRRDHEVRYAEPDYIGRASAVTPNVPNDSSFGLQWGSQNTGQSIPSEGTNEIPGAPTNGTPGADDKAAWAWNTTTGSRSIVIGEVDTGVNYNHPDLAGNIWTNPGPGLVGVGGCPQGSHGYNVVPITPTCDPMDDDNSYGGHGTHVAGILGAAGNNSAGVAGMNWSTTILPVKWLDSNATGTTAGLISALAWLITAKQEGVNVRVVNDSATFAGDAYSQALSDEIDALGANNILFVTAAGNTGQNNDTTPRYPCSYRRANEICVTASDLNDKIPSWANYGNGAVDLAAPGVSVYSTLRNGGYGYLSGGSMAAPQVAGAAALALSSDPSLSASALKSAILSNVDVIPGMAGLVQTGGRLNVCKAIPGCQQPALTITRQALPAANGTSAVLNGSVSPQNTSTSYYFRYSPNQDMSGASTTASQSAGAGPTGTPVSQTASGLQANTTYYFQVVATNSAGTSTGSILTFNTSLGPQVSTQSASPVTGSSAALNGLVNPENSQTTYTFYYSPNPDMSSATSTAPQSAGSGSGSQPVSQLVTGLLPNTNYYFEVQATNGSGSSISPVDSFVTSTPPLAATQPAQSITTTSAVLTGVVNPQNSSTTYVFEYSPNPNMSGALELPANNPQDVGSDDSSHAVSQSVSGLSPGTAYYFQVVATNVATPVRTTIGSVQSFTTLSTAAVTLPPSSPGGPAAVGPAGGSGGGKSPAALPKPSLSSRVLTGQTLTSLLTRGLTVRVRCAARCLLTADLLIHITVKLPRHRIRTTSALLGKSAKTLAGGHTLQFTITLSHAGRRAVMHLLRAILTLQLSAVARGGNAHASSAATTTTLHLALVRSSGRKLPHHARR